MTTANFLDSGTVHGLPRQVDVLIVGSGPVGSTYARRIADLAPRARILMVEAGPRLTDRPGVHVANIADETEREQARRRSEGRALTRGEPPAASLPLRDLALLNSEKGPTPQPGVFFVDPVAAHEGRPGTLSAAAMSCNVGGMGSHWAGFAPTPRGRERVRFIPNDEWEDALAVGKRLLSVTQQATLHSATWGEFRKSMVAAFDGPRPEADRFQDGPFAARLDPSGAAPYRTGPDVILGDLASRPRDTFAIAAETLCRELLLDGRRVAGALLEHLPSGRTSQVLARVVVVAADSLRTPQLLWRSGIRPAALGHYLNDHQMIGGMVLPRYLDAPDDPEAFMSEAVVRGPAVFGQGWIPYCDDVRPVHGQVGQIEIQQPNGRTVGMAFLGFMLPKDIRFEDCVRFRDDVLDAYGMPSIEFDYQLTERDQTLIELAEGLVERGTAALGDAVPGMGSWSQPPGSSLHYMGTVRMGEHDDGESVCDSHSRVWGLDNLFVGCNGVIPSPIACNPTLTSVSLASRAATAAAAVAVGSDWSVR